MNISKNKIQRSFSKVAKKYDQLCGFHDDIAGQLIKRIPEIKDPERVLDVGMGTGLLTRKIKDKFPQANLVGLDFSSGMIKTAKSKNKALNLVQADLACLPFKENSFDVILSNLSYQWEYDLKQAFSTCRKVLRPEGMICFSIFGHGTFEELFLSIESSLKLKDPKKRFFMDRLADKESILNAVSSAGFSDIEIERTEHKLFFSDMIEIIKWIKGIGGNTLNRSYYLGKELLFLSNDHYSRNFRNNGKVFTTLEVVWVKARK